MGSPLYNGDFLGSPFGSIAHVQSFVAQKVSRLQDKAQLIAGVEDRQTALVLLRQCSGFCEVTHLMRSCSFDITEQLQKVDEVVKWAASEVLGQGLEGSRWDPGTAPHADGRTRPPFMYKAQECCPVRFARTGKGYLC